MANPTFTRANTPIGVTTPGVAQTTITPTYTAASAGGYLVAILFMTTSNGVLTCAGPNGNWTQQGSTVSVHNTAINDWLLIFVFQNSAVDSSTSATFSFSGGGATGGSPFAIVYEFNATSGVDATNIFSANTGANGATATTGSGTAQETNDYQLIAAMTNDSIFTSPSTPSGFANDLALGDHGDGASSFGGSAACYHATAVNSSTTIASNTITWTSANSWGLGATVLMRPVIGIAPLPPNYEGGMACYAGGMAA